MPGLSLVYRVAGESLPSRERWLGALECAHGDVPSRRVSHLEDDRCRIGSDRHEHYPIEIREDARCFVALEGRIYAGASGPPVDDLWALAASLSDGADETEAIRSRVRAWEGEFVGVVYARAERRLWIFSDSLGRLPLYAVVNDAGLEISRDQRFLLELAGGGAVDRVGIAQLLVFGFPLGRHTLARGVERVTPGLGFRADPGGIRAMDGLAEPFCFGREERKGIAPERNAAELADHFTAACRVRAGAVHPPLLALSGGLDSRAVGAGLVRAERSFDAFTMRDVADVYGREVPVAAAVAAALGSPWREFRAPAPRGETLQRMLEMKVGLNSLAMAFGLPIFETLRETYGTGRSYWSGDGGDKVLPDHRPRLSRADQADLAGYLIHSRPLWPAGEVARMVGVGEEELRAGIETLIGAYPERSPDQRFVRFNFVERGARWIFEGEDCNRHQFWTVAPFFDRAFLKEALACPDGQKSGHQLYRRFLRRLHPALNRIPDANLGIAMDSFRYSWSRRLREEGRRFPRLRRWFRKGMPSSVLQPAPGLMGALLSRQLEHSDSVRSCFSVAALGEVAASPGQWTDAALDSLVTATCACEHIMGGRSSLAEFAAESFG